MGSDSRLTALLYEINQLASSPVGLKDLIERTGELVFHSTAASSLSISLRDNRGVAQFSKSRSTSEGSAIFARMINAPGITYGHVELQASPTTLRHDALLQLVDILASQLGLAAARGHTNVR